MFEKCKLLYKFIIILFNVWLCVLMFHRLDCLL